MRLTYLRLPITSGFFALLLSGLVLLFGSGPQALAMSEHSTDGHVYVLNNDLGGSNSITVFNREEDGLLSLSGTTSIGGAGSVAAFADGTIANYFTGAILPSVLHQGPRFFQSGKGSFVHRTLYAMSRNLITRTDSGHSQFNYSEVVGGAMAAAISTYSYHPSADKTLSNTASVWATQYGYDTLTLVVKEFWPDIRRKISKKRKGGAEPEKSNP